MDDEYKHETILTAADWLFPVTHRASQMSSSVKPMSISFSNAFMSGLKSRRFDVLSESNNVATNRMSDGDLIFLRSEVPETLHHSTIDKDTVKLEFYNLKGQL